MSLPSEELWYSWGFMERMDWAAREVSLQGRHLTSWILAFHFGRWVLQNVIFVAIIWCLPESDGDSKEWVWRIVVRYAIFCHVLESFGWRHGPMCGGRVTPWPLGWFTNAHYRLTRGTFRFTGTKLMRYLMGDRRGVIDVIGNVCFLVFGLTAVLVPQRFPLSVNLAAVATFWIWISDQPQCTDGKGTTHVHFILAGCVSAANGGVACGQIQLLIVWIASGLCKIGPWMSFVNGPLLGGSVWCRGRKWVWRLLYRGLDDLRPTLLSDMVSQHAAHPEWLCPLLLFFPSYPWLIYCGLSVLVAMHIYIMANAGLDVLCWNGFFIFASLCLFGGGTSIGFDYAGFCVAPRPLLIWYFMEAIVIGYGWLYPGEVSFQAGHRNWAGNEPVAIILLRRDAAFKLSASLPIIGRPTWDPVPPELRCWYPTGVAAPHLGDMSAFKVIAAYWLGFLNMKIIPALVQRAMGTHEISDFYIMNHMQFWDNLWGSFFFCPTHIVEILNALQRIVSFEEGECICAWATGFPVAGPFWGGARWQIIDAKAGVIEAGEVSLLNALAVARLPSDCVRTNPLARTDELQGDDASKN